MTYYYTPLELHENSLEQRRKRIKKTDFFPIKSLDEKLEFKGTKTTKYIRKVFLIKVVSENGFGPYNRVTHQHV